MGDDSGPLAPRDRGQVLRDEKWLLFHLSCSCWPNSSSERRISERNLRSI